MFIRREEYEDMRRERNRANERYTNKCVEYHNLMKICDEQWDEFTKLREENAKLQQENGYFKALVDKESDTEVIKYNGKLFRIQCRSNIRPNNEPESMGLDTVCIGEAED